MLNLSNENIIQQKKNGIEYLQFKKLLQYPELVHCYTLKANDFDVAGNDTYKDKIDMVHQNYEKLADTLEIQKETIIRPYQNHTNIVKNVGAGLVSDIEQTLTKIRAEMDSAPTQNKMNVGADSISAQNKPQTIMIFPQELNNVDGLTTDIPNITFSLTYADCTPLYLYDEVKKVIGNIHSGWKGTLQRIGQIAVKNMIEEYGCNPENIICCIGPCIKKCHFEVSQDVKEQFANEFKEMRLDEIIEDKGNNKFLIDTTLINKNMLKQIGIKEENIIDSGICTVCNEKQMHSYRAHKEAAGRNTAIIGLRK